MSLPIERFSSRVENYVRYRPGYPAEILDLLKFECGLTAQSIVADIGSGTGKLSELFLKNGNKVFGIEPNAAMREAGEIALKTYSRFHSTNGRAEATTLTDASIDFVTAGQAFHWFDVTKAKAECLRILKPEGWVVLVWNERRIDTTPFLRAYEQLLLTYGTDYEEVRHENANDAVAEFFAPSKPTMKLFENAQSFDFESLQGRVLSSSYIPEPDQPDFEPMLKELRRIFEIHQRMGVVSFDYETKVYYGHIRA